MKKSEQTNSYIVSAESKALLEKCHEGWLALSKVRDERARNVKFKNGDQWSDLVEDPNKKGYAVREDELLAREGKTPLKHNFIQQFIRNISGQMLSNPSQSVVYTRDTDTKELGEMLTNALQACHHLNQGDRLNLSVMEELLLSGLACVKVRYEYWHSKSTSDGMLENVNINRLFFNHDIEDTRLFDIEMIGEIHDFTIDEVVCNYASSPSQEEELRNIYNSSADSPFLSNAKALKGSQTQNMSFLKSNDRSKCRVIEVWERRGRWITVTHDYQSGCELIEKSGRIRDLGNGTHTENRYEQYWHMTCLTPTGEILSTMETPYLHGEHPYIITTLPLIDGTTHSFISDIIDIQKYINRLIVMIDFIMGASAKGVLMVPENAIPDGYSVDDFTSEYVKANGVIIYKPNHTRDVPFQISSNSTNVGAWEMLSLQMNLIQQISGLSGAIQGERAKGYMPSSLYAQEANNSQLNHRVLFDTIRLHQQLRDEKLLKVLMQFYTTQRYINVAGNSYSTTAIIYQPDKAANISDFNLVVSQSMDTPVYKQIIEDSLKNMLDTKQIDLEMYLSNSSFPFASRLLSQVRKKKEEEAQ